MPRIITLYTSPDCQPCKAVKRWFAKNGVEYTEKDVTKDPMDLAAVKALGYLKAPVTVVSTGDPDIELHWQGLHMANMAKYTLTTTKAA